MCKPCNTDSQLPPRGHLAITDSSGRSPGEIKRKFTESNFRYHGLSQIAVPRLSLLQNYPFHYFVVVFLSYLFQDSYSALRSHVGGKTFPRVNKRHVWPQYIDYLSITLSISRYSAGLFKSHLWRCQAKLQTPGDDNVWFKQHWLCQILLPIVSTCCGGSSRFSRIIDSLQCETVDSKHPRWSLQMTPAWQLAFFWSRKPEAHQFSAYFNKGCDKIKSVRSSRIL